MATPRSTDKLVQKFAPPSKPSGSHANLLVPTESCKDIEPKALDILHELDVPTDATAAAANDGCTREMTNQYRVDAVHTCLKLIERYSALYQHLSAYREMFAPISGLLAALPTTGDHRLPGSVTELRDSLCFTIAAVSAKPRSKLVGVKPKPKLVKLVEPRIEENFDLRKSRRAGSRESSERARLVHKHRREMKSAVREIKKDSQFLARQQLQDQMLKDAERKEKVKRIYSQLATQEGEIRNIKKQKVKVKF